MAEELEEITEETKEFKEEKKEEKKEVHYAPPTEDDPILGALAYGNINADGAVAESEIDSATALAEKIEEVSAERGFKVKQSVFSTILSAMAASHFIFIKGLDDKTVNGLISLLNTAFGSSNAVLARASNDFSSSLASNYDMLKSLDDDNILRIKRVYGKTWEEFSESYKEIVSNMPTVYGFLDSESKNLRGDGKAIFNNIFIMCALDDGMDIYQMPRVFADASAVIELSQADVVLQTSGSADAEKYAGVAPMNGNQFSDFVQTARSKYSLSLSAWKKLDKLQALIEKPEHPIFGNIQIRQIERFVSVYMELGASEDEAFDRVFCCKILPMISEEIKATIGSEIVISDSIESIFGIDALQLTKNEIIKIQTSYISSQNR